MDAEDGAEEGAGKQAQRKRLDGRRKDYRITPFSIAYMYSLEARITMCSIASETSNLFHF